MTKESNSKQNSAYEFISYNLVSLSKLFFSKENDILFISWDLFNFFLHSILIIINPKKSEKPIKKKKEKPYGCRLLLHMTSLTIRELRLFRDIFFSDEEMYRMLSSDTWQFLCFLNKNLAQHMLKLRDQTHWLN